MTLSIFFFFSEKTAYFIGNGKSRRLDFPIASTTKQSKSFVDQMKTLPVSPFSSSELFSFLSHNTYSSSRRFFFFLPRK